jgi:hypothetical protein
MIPKHKRIIDLELLAFVRGIPCIACAKPGPNEAHHVSTRGSGGGDTFENCMSLCVDHHRAWHLKGPKWMCEKYPSVQYWLEAADRWDVIERGLKK